MYAIVADLDGRIEDDMQNGLPIEMTLSVLYFLVATSV
jgi:hypothetical protein